MHRDNFSRTYRWLLTLGFFVVLAASAPLMGCSEDPGGGDLLGNDGNDSQPDAGDNDTNAENSETPDAGPDDDSGRPSTDSGGDWDWDDDEDFAILSVNPARGPVAGGTRVHIHGTDLNSNTQILFGNQPVDVELSQGQLIATTPAAEGTGPVTVRAISPGGDTSEIPNGFTYADPVRVDSVVPHILPTTGGVEITLTGAGFVEPMGVSFSGTEARRIDVINSKTARVVAPPMSRGYADLRVTIADEYDLIEDAVYFYTPIAIDTVDPAVGDVDGGDVVTLRGQGITSDLSVEFDGKPANIQSTNIGAGEVTVITPSAGETGSVDIALENQYDSRRLNDGFYYDDGAQDSIYSIQPNTAPVAGGTEHLISGRNLDASNAAIFVGGQEATIIDSGSDFARIEAPSVTSPGPVDIRFERGGVEVDRIDDGLEYIRGISITEISPDSGTADGGESVSIYGEGLTDVDEVSFGGLSASFEIVDDGKITATTPSAEPGVVDVTITAGDRHVVLEDGYQFDGAVEVWSMRPSRGSIAGNTYVTLQGRGFSGLIEVDVGGVEADEIRRLDPYTITFRTPPSSNTGARDVTVEAVGQQTEPPYPFVYFNPMSSFGGAHGPSIENSVNITVIAQNGAPIPNAFVMLSTRPDTPYRGYTNSSGQLTISGQDVLGPQTITATAANFSTVTVRELDAQNLTIILNPIEPGEGGGGGGNPPPLAHIDGTITITGKNADPDGGDIYNMSTIRTTRSAMLSGETTPGPDSTVAGEGSFEVRTRVGDMALIGLCGFYDEMTETFTPKMMAVERYISMSNGQQKTIDLECNIPLEETLDLRILDPVFAPDGPNNNQVTPFLDFGYEGVYRMPETTSGLGDILQAGPLPAPEDDLSDISYSAIAGSYTGSGLPYSQTTVEGITNLDQLHSTAPLVAVPELLDPAPGGIIDGEIRLGLRGINPPDLYYIIIRNMYGLPVWTFVVPGDDDLIPMPEFPSFSDLPADLQPEPYQLGQFYGIAYGIRIDEFDYDAFTYSDFSTGRWSAFSVNSFNISLHE